MKNCLLCGENIPARVLIDGKVRMTNKRKYCLNCSPFGKKNTRQLHLSENKICVDCGELFAAKRQIRCGKCNYKIRSNKRLKEISKIIGTACWLCGYDKGNSFRGLMDFHHVDPKEKKFQVDSRTIATLRLEKLEEEMRKCCFLCCRCHREFHAGLISSDKIKEIYEKKWENIPKIYVAPTPEKCICCDKARAKHSRYCSHECAVKNKKRKLTVTKEELLKLIETVPLEKIGKMFGVSGKAVKKRCNVLGITTRFGRGSWTKLIREGKVGLTPTVEL